MKTHGESIEEAAHRADRVFLKLLEQQLRDLQDESERVTVEVRSVTEYHKGRASAFGHARALVRQFDATVRAVQRKARR